MPLVDTAREEIAALQASGLQLTPEEIVWINELAMDVECTPGRVHLAAAGEPVRMGNRVMWPFTVASAGWWTKVTRLGWFTTQDGARNALAFCLCNGRTPEVFEDILTEDDARRAVNAWILKAGATPAEREAAIIRCVPEIGAPHAVKRKNEKTDDEGTDKLIAELVAGTGLPADYWQGQLQSHAVRCLMAVYRQASLGGMGGGSVSDEEKARYSEAMMQLQLASKAIREAHRAES
jgi:hypothetical protein